jgi:hypothetical protein
MARERSLTLPDYIVAGPGRTGTTWLHQVLEGHVDLPYGIKETLFFNRFYDSKGIDWYARHFRFATGDRPVVELCGSYFFKPEAVERIKLHIPNCRFIMTMRDPVDRIYSEYKLMRHFAAVRRGTFEEVLDAWPTLAGGGRYASRIKAFAEAFGRENVLITMYDELRTEPQKYLNRVTDFIRIERIALSERPGLGNEVNAFKRAPKNRRLARRAKNFEFWLRGRQAYGVYQLLKRTGAWEFCFGRGEIFPPLTPEQDASLRARLLPDVEALEEFMQIDLSAWKRPRAPRTIQASPAPPVAAISQPISAHD